MDLLPIFFDGDSYSMLQYFEEEHSEPTPWVLVKPQCLGGRTSWDRGFFGMFIALSVGSLSTSSTCQLSGRWVFFHVFCERISTAKKNAL